MRKQPAQTYRHHWSQTGPKLRWKRDKLRGHHTHKERKKWCRATAGNEPRIYRSPSGGCGCGCCSRIFLRRASTTGFSYWVFLLIWLCQTEKIHFAHIKDTQNCPLKSFSVSWHAEARINLLYVVHSVHRVLYPLPSWRQLWVHKRPRITLWIITDFNAVELIYTWVLLERR